MADVNTFTEKVLPSIFGLTTYSSFIRQLNIYGFHKYAREKKGRKEEYMNENFKRGHPELLNRVTRKKKLEDLSKTSKGDDCREESSNGLFFSPPHSILDSQYFSSQEHKSMVSEDMDEVSAD